LAFNQDTTASSDLKQIEEWAKSWPHANVGLLCDVEVDGVPQLPDFEKALGPLPATFTVQSGKGGRHYYFAGETARRTRPFKPFAIDVCGRGGYVMAPGRLTRP
jgi:hypothetical protein